MLPLNKTSSTTWFQINLPNYLMYPPAPLSVGEKLDPDIIREISEVGNFSCFVLKYRNFKLNLKELLNTLKKELLMEK
jgi:hypothetical protein